MSGGVANRKPRLHQAGGTPECDSNRLEANWPGQFEVLKSIGANSLPLPLGLLQY